MPRAGGIFSLIPGYFATDGTTIEVSQHNPPLEDIAQALTDSLPRDGSAPMTGNLAMGAKKITGLAAATVASDAVRFDQLPTLGFTTGTLTAGTDAQGQGPITTDLVTVTTTAANPSGVTLPTPVAGKTIRVINRGTNPINLYPASGGTIGALALNAPLFLPVGVAVDLFARTTTQWEGYAAQAYSSELAGIAANGGVTTANLTAATLVTSADTIASNNNDTTIPTSAAVKAYADGNSPIKAWANFSGVPLSGTYSRAGTLVTVTMTDHGMVSGQYAFLDFTSGIATDGYYQITNTGANTFTVVTAASGTTSGNVTRNVWVRSSLNVASVVDNGVGDFTVNFTSAMADANYCAIVVAGGAGTLPVGNALVGWPAIYGTGSIRVGISDNNSDISTDAPNINIAILG